MTSIVLLLLFTGGIAAVAAVAVWLGRPLSFSALAAAFGLPLLFLLPGFFTATTALPVDHSLGFWPWHAQAKHIPRNVNLNDLATQMAPWAKAVRMAYKEGSLPLRDRWNGCGTPLAANGQSAAFSPFTLLGLMLPLARAATLTGALKLALALAGMWLWLRELRISDGAALFGAICFAFSMTMIPWLYFPHTAVICLWPWCLFAVELLRDRAASDRAFALLLAIFAVWPLCGHIESVALGCGFLALWLAARAASGEVRELPRLAGGIFLAGVLALAVSAFLLVPQVLAIRASNRFAQVARPVWSGHFSLMPRTQFWNAGLLTMLFPRLFGDGITAPMIAGGAGSFPEMALGSIGLVGWSLALCFLRPGGRRKRSEWALLVPIVLGLGAAIDLWPFAEIAGGVPLLRLMFPLRFFSWVAIGAAALAAFEVDRLREDLATARRAWVFPAVVALLLAVLGWAAFSRVAGLHIASGGWPSARHARALSVAILLAVSAVCIALGLARNRSKLVTPALIVLSTAALLWEGARIYRFESINLLFPDTPLVRFLESRPRPFRVVGEGAALFPNTNVFAQVEDIRTHDPVERRDYVNFLDASCGYDPAAYFKMIRDLNAPALDFLNVRYLVWTPGKEPPGPKWKPAYSGVDGTVFENSDAFPRFFAVDRAAPLEMTGYRETTNRISFHVRASGQRPATVAGSIVQDGGWTAQDETHTTLPTSLYRGLFLEFSVPSGDHDVVLDYSPPGFRTGCWISLAGILATLLTMARMRAKTSIPTTDPP